MKIRILFMFVVSFFLLAVSTGVMANNQDGMMHRIYIGGSTMPFKLSGLKDMDLTDAKNDLGGDQFIPKPVIGADEGRIFLELAEKEESGYHPGGGIGYEFLIDDFGIALEFEGYAGSSTIISGFFGLEYRFINNESFYIGLMPKIGFTSVSIDLGKTKISSGYTPPVYIYEDGQKGKGIEADKDLKAQINAFTYQVVLTAGFFVTDHLEIFANVGFTQSFFSDLKIKADGETIEHDSHQLIDHGVAAFHGGVDQRAMPDPEVESIGAFALVGVAYNFY